MNQPTFRDVELISTYLDGQLPQVDVVRLETRIKSDAQLRMVFEDMSQARSLLRKLPARRAPRNFTLTARMAGIKPPLPRSFPMFRFASVLATLLFFFAFAFNISVPAMTALRAALPAPVLGMGGGGGGGPENPAAMESAPAAAAPQAPALPNAADTLPTSTADARALAAPTQAAEIPAATDLPYATEAAPLAPGSQAKISPPAQDNYQALPQQVPVQLPISPLLLFGLLGIATLSGATAYFVRLRTESQWFKERALKSGQVNTREALFILLVILLLAALTFSIYWLATTTFYAPVPVAQAFPGGMTDKGPVSLPDKGSATTPGTQEFTLSSGLGYSFSTADANGLVTAIDFPADVFKSEMQVSYLAGVSDTGDIPYPSLGLLTLTPADKNVLLQAPFVISLDYDPKLNPGMDESKLVLFWWSGSEWQDAATTCGTTSTYERMPDAHRVRVAVCQMGSFVLAMP